MRVFALVLAVGAVALVGCRKSAETTTEAPKEQTVTTEKGEQVSLKVGPGVDAKAKTISVGALNDESGPAAALGKPFAIGKRVAVAHANEKGSKMLPDGWQVKLVEKDHGYDPQKSVQAYKEIRDDVLFVGTSFGTPPTMPLRKDLARDEMMAFPASLSSAMAEHPWTPPLGPAYKLEARRAMDWAVEKMGGADKVKAAIIYNQDDYGKDGLEGWEAQAQKHGVTIVDKHAATPGQKDFTAVIASLKEKGANVVLLTVLPSATGPVLGTAAKMQYGPTWIGNLPSWLDAFFSPKVIPAAVFANYYWVQGMPYWGEDVPGMKEFEKAFATHGGDARKDFYTLLSYVQGMVQLEAARRAIEANDLTRAGYASALRSLKGFEVMGLRLDLSATPYATSTKTRVLKPVMDKATWEVVGPAADPK